MHKRCSSEIGSEMMEDNDEMKIEMDKLNSYDLHFTLDDCISLCV